MVKINRIYTRTGDAGETGLGDGARVSKADPRVDAIGEVDTANAVVGLAVSVCDDQQPCHTAIRAALLDAQQDLFDLGADLCVPLTLEEAPGARLRVAPAQTKRLENAIDIWNKRLAPLTSFVLPGGCELAARLHVARTAVRTAERRLRVLFDTQPDTTNPETLVYLNRLSDLLFVLARVANDDGQADRLWTPGVNRDNQTDSA